jgi:hypothetical protein
VDKKSPIVRTIRRPQSSSDVLVSRSKISSADSFFACDKVETELLAAGTIVKWRSFCGIVGTGRIQKIASVDGAWLVECMSPSPEVWQKEGVPARKGDVCVVYDWQLVMDI